MATPVRTWLAVLLVLPALATCGAPKSPETPQPPSAPPAVETPSPEPVSESSAPTPEPLAYQPVILEPEAAELLDQEGSGKLCQVGELLVCVLEGTHREMGYQHGRLLARKIQHIAKEGYLQQAGFDNGYTLEYAVEQSTRMARHFPPEYLDELHGILEGLEAAGVSEVTYEELLIAACVAELLHHAPNSPPACSNFAVFGQWTPDGRLLHGRNLDWTIGKGAQKDAVAFVFRPEGGIPFMMLAYAGVIGGVSGMNASQITIGEMTASSPEESFDGIPLQMIMRMVLEKAKTLDEAVAIIERGPRTLGWNFVLGDGKIPDVRALEVDRNTVDVFTPGDPRETPEIGHQPLPDAIRRTNHPCGEIQQRKVVQARGAEIGLDGGDWDAVKPLAKAFLAQQNTFHRYQWLGEQIQARPKAIDVSTALALLSNGPVAANNTLHSFVFDPAKQTAYIAHAAVAPPVTAWKTVYTRLDLSPWF